MKNEMQERQAQDETLMALGKRVHGMMSAGKPCPTELIMSAPEGMSKLVFNTLPRGMSGDDFARLCRTACVATGARAALLISGTWFKTVQVGEKLAFSKPQMQYSEPREAVLMIFESRERRQQRILPVRRSADGKFQGFEPDYDCGVGRCEGRFPNLLPDESPNAWDQGIAKGALVIRGVRLETIREGEKWHQQQRKRRHDHSMVIG